MAAVRDNHVGNSSASHRAAWTSRRRAWLAGLAAAGVVILVTLGVGAVPLVAAGDYGSGQWVWQAISSRLSLICAGAFFAAAAGVAILAGVLWRAGQRWRRVMVGGEGGAAIVEFALILPILLLLVLLMAQSSLLMSGNLCVHYSAFCAARSAIVNVPASLSADEPVNYVAEEGGSAKLQRIRQAAIWTLMPVSCGSRLYPAAQASELQAGLANFFRAYGKEPPIWIMRQLPHRIQYATDYTDVRLKEARSGALYAENEDLVVYVDHVLHLSVPYISRIFSMGEDGRELDFSPGQYGLLIRATSRLPNEGVIDTVTIEKFASDR